MLLSSDSEDEAPPSQSKLRINESYAKRLEHNKAREELHRLQAKYGDVKLSSTKENGEDELEEESSTSEEEDEFGELVTPRVDAEIWRTLAMIREGRPEIYDENWKVFTDDDAEDNAAEKKGKEKPMYLKDYHRKNLLEGGPEDETDRPITTYEQEQQALKDAFHAPLPESDEEADLIQRKSKDQVSEEKAYQNFLKESLQDEPSRKLLQELESLGQAKAQGAIETEDPEAFLANYLLNRTWLKPPAQQQDLYEDDSSDEEKVEEFETKYNFRFEQPEGGILVTHARTISTARRGDEKRKKERERKKTKREEEKRKEIEDIARLRNLKRMEIEERIKRAEEVGGAGGWTEKDLEGDFDPDEWDKRTKDLFNETYYATEEDRKKPKFDDIDITDLVPEQEQETDVILETGPKTLSKREKAEKKRKIEELLDETVPLNPSASKFRYREVSPTSFGLSAGEILIASDAQLNEFVGLKKLAPYRDHDLRVRDQRKYGKKKRLREWRRKVIEEGEDEDVKAVLRPNNVNTKPVEPAEPKKKRKSRKSNAKTEME